MSEVLTQGRQDASVVTKAGSSWVHEDPANVAFRVTVPGMMCPIGWSKETLYHPNQEAKLPDGSSFLWDAMAVDYLRLSHPAHLMLIEGVVPAWLFLGAQFVSIPYPDLRLKGPFMLLRLDSPPIHQTPFTLSNVVFGIPSIPEGAKLGDLVPAMVFELLSHSFS